MELWKTTEQRKQWSDAKINTRFTLEKNQTKNNAILPIKTDSINVKYRMFYFGFEVMYPYCNYDSPLNLENCAEKTCFNLLTIKLLNTKQCFAAFSVDILRMYTFMTATLRKPYILGLLWSFHCKDKKELVYYNVYICKIITNKYLNYGKLI